MNENNKIREIFDDNARHVYLNYNNDYLTEIKDIDNNTLIFEYDDNGRIKKGIDAKNTCYFTNTYDASGRIIKQEDGIGSSPTLFNYDAEFTRITTDRNGYDSTRIFNSDGLLTQYTDANGNIKKYVYDNNTNLIEETDSNENCKKTVYIAVNRPIEVTDKNGNVIRYEYDTYGRLTHSTGSSDVIFKYNGRDGVISYTNSLIYMRARYYSTAFLRFINADILHGSISDSTSLNRYSYVNGNPVSFVDPFGLSKEERSNIRTKCDSHYYDSEAYKKIVNNADYILQYAELYDVDPKVVAGVIFVEQYYNYDWIDKLTDWIAFYGIDMSVGLGQVRLSTAVYLEENEYVPKSTAKEGRWNIPLIGFINGTETMSREKKLENNSINIYYVSAYLRALEDLWINDFPEIESRRDILGSLYNLGHNRKPHANPEPNWFGEYVDYFYYLVGDALR